jgi:uncharacterized protein
VKIGLISDTHGLVRPEALAALEGSQLILHAGDVGRPEVLDALRAVAPVCAVRGNNDRGAWAQRLPERRTVRVANVLVHLVHDLSDLRIDPRRRGIALVVSGHSHRPVVRHEDGVVFANPGSAGPRRFSLPVSLARCEIVGRRVRVRLIQIPSRRINR